MSIDESFARIATALEKIADNLTKDRITVDTECRVTKGVTEVSLKKNKKPSEGLKEGNSPGEEVDIESVSLDELSRPQLINFLNQNGKIFPKHTRTNTLLALAKELVDSTEYKEEEPVDLEKTSPPEKEKEPVNPEETSPPEKERELLDCEKVPPPEEKEDLVVITSDKARAELVAVAKKFGGETAKKIIIDAMDGEDCLLKDCPPDKLAIIYENALKMKEQF
jgi:hypothetical protein